MGGHSERFDEVTITPDGTQAVSASQDGTRAVSASQDGTLKVWDLEAGRQLHTLPGHSAAVITSIAVAADGRRAVSAAKERTLNCTLKGWDLETGRELCTHYKATLAGTGCQATLLVLPALRWHRTARGRSPYLTPEFRAAR
jgi:WD40 repeat protein